MRPTNVRRGTAKCQRQDKSSRLQAKFVCFEPIAQRPTSLPCPSNPKPGERQRTSQTPKPVQRPPFRAATVVTLPLDPCPFPSVSSFHHCPCHCCHHARVKRPKPSSEQSNEPTRDNTPNIPAPEVPTLFGKP